MIENKSSLLFLFYLQGRIKVSYIHAHASECGVHSISDGSEYSGISRSYGPGEGDCALGTEVPSDPYTDLSAFLCDNVLPGSCEPYDPTGIIAGLNSDTSFTRIHNPPSPLGTDEAHGERFKELRKTIVYSPHLETLSQSSLLYIYIYIYI